MEARIQYAKTGDGGSVALTVAGSGARWAHLEALLAHGGVGQFSLYGRNYGCAAATAYAVAHPDRVKRLVLLGAFARGADFYTAVPEIAVGTRMAGASMPPEEAAIYYQSMAGIVSGFSDPE